MPRAGNTFVLTGTSPHTQLSMGAGPSEQTLTLQKDCTAVMVSAKTANVFVTFDNTAAASTNGIEIVSGAQPVILPVGYMAHSAHVLRAQSAAANGILNVLQLA